MSCHHLLSEKYDLLFNIQYHYLTYLKIFSILTDDILKKIEFIYIMFRSS